MKSFFNATLILSVSLILAACGGDNTTSSKSSNLVPDEPVPNSAPVISGTPSNSVAEGSSYQFTPVAFDEDGDSLLFSVENLPTWADFNTSTGRLSGTPGTNAAGDYSNISISVSDGELSATLPSFSITVVDISDQTPPPGTDPMMGAPTMESATISDTNIVLTWSMDSYAIPEGGYDVFIDGVDTGPQYRTTSTTTTIPGLDLTQVHCFNVESRYVDTGDFFSSNQVCTVVQEPSPVETGSFTLNWTAPSTRSDGSPLDMSEIGGYQVYVGDSSDNLQMEMDLSEGSATTTTITGKPLGSYFVAITVYDTNGNASSFSNVIEVSATN